MTGYGKTLVAITGRNLNIEIRTLNSKQLDLNLKLPAFLRDREGEIRGAISRSLERGKVDFVVSVENTGEKLSFTINRKLAVKYHEQLKELAGDLATDMPDEMLSLILRMPDVMENSAEELTPLEGSMVMQSLEEALQQTVTFRRQEGSVLEKDLLMRVQMILELLDSIAPHESVRSDNIRERLGRNFSRFGEDNPTPPPDPVRFEQELLYYLERIDFTEEKVRLLKHCEYFLETLNEQGNQGKKLGFITQEMGREINTIGSKANDAVIQRLVVRMKDELEKIKEQLANIL